jgi:translation initiation factor 5A
MSSHAHPKEAHHVKKGCYVMLKDRPCKIVEVKTSKTGKHGHAKCNITGMDVLTNKKYNEVHPGHIILRAFDLHKNEYDVTDIEDGLLTVLDEDGEQHVFKVNFAEDKDPVSYKMKQEFDNINENGLDKFLQCVISTAPYGTAGNEKTDHRVCEWKEGKD